MKNVNNNLEADGLELGHYLERWLNELELFTMTLVPVN